MKISKCNKCQSEIKEIRGWFVFQPTKKENEIQKYTMCFNCSEEITHFIENNQFAFNPQDE